jgi:hypothetical protein
MRIGVFVISCVKITYLHVANTQNVWCGCDSFIDEGLLLDIWYVFVTMHHSNYNRDKSHIAHVTEKYYGSITKIEILKHNDKIERKPHWSTYIYVRSSSMYGLLITKLTRKVDCV